MHIESKLPDVGTTIFTVMSALANECGAINLSQGFPDFSAPESLLDSVERAMRRGFNQYAPMIGMPALLDAIRRKVDHFYQAKLSETEEITITSGATEALFCAISAVVGAGDEVIMLDPAYDSYDPVVRLNHGVPVHVPLRPPTYGVDWQRVRNAITPKTRMIVVNSPHNPTGAVFSPADLDQLAEITRDTDITVLSDEVYEHIVFDGAAHQSVLLREELRTRSFVVSSFGKSFHATGWKLGYCVAPPQLTKEFRRIHQFVTFTSCTPMQIALAQAMDSFGHLEDLPLFYQEKRDYFRRAMQPSRFKLLPCGGTYFQLADYSEISHQSDIEFVKWLTREMGVAAIPVSVFNANGDDAQIIRFCFAKQPDTLQRAADILCGI